MALDLSDPELQAGWNSITKDNGKNWILFKFAGNTNKLQVAGTGEGGIEELKRKLSDDEIMFGAFKVIGVDNRETTISRRPKFVWFTWQGSRVSVLKRGKVSVQKPDIARFFDSAHFNVELKSLDDLSKQDIAKRLFAVGGAHKPTSYQFSDDPNDEIYAADL